MKTILHKTILTFLVNISLVNLVPAQDFQWVAGIACDDHSFGRDIVVNDDEYIYSIGTYAETTDLDPGPDSFFVYVPPGRTNTYIQCLDENGNFVWGKELSGSGDVSGRITIDKNGDLVIAGRFSGTIDFDPGPLTLNHTSSLGYAPYLLKLDSNGDYKWVKYCTGVPGKGAYYSALSTDQEANIYLAGMVRSEMDIDPGSGSFLITPAGGMDVFFTKLDSDGNFQWGKRIGETGNEFCNGLVADPLGNIYATGYFEDTVDFDPGAGTFELMGAALTGNFFLKLDTGGNFVWARSIEGKHDKYANNIDIDAAGNIYASGIFTGTVDLDPGPAFQYFTTIYEQAYLIKLNNAGQLEWARQYLGKSNRINGIKVGNHGSVYTTGHFYDIVDCDLGAGTLNLDVEGPYDFDGFIQKIDPGAGLIWARSLRGPESQSCYGIAIAADEDFYTTGSFRDSTDFNPGATDTFLVSPAFYIGNAFVLKLSSPTVGMEEEIPANGPILYPNPTNGELTIEMKEPLGAIQVRNIHGQIVQESPGNGTNRMRLKIEGATGLYFISVTSGDQQAVIKVVKE